MCYLARDAREGVQSRTSCGPVLAGILENVTGNSSELE